jgi:hypothetical protein
MSRIDDDPDDTEGRRLYRARANGLASSQLSIAKRRVKLSAKHTVKEVIEFGEKLIKTGDLDPVYIALAGAELPYEQMFRLLLAYFLFYHLGAAARLSEMEGEAYWDLMEVAAEAHAIPPSTDDLPGDSWPRGTERRHFRGRAAIYAMQWFRTKCQRPEGYVELLLSIPQPAQLETVMRTVQDWNMCGPWIAFKVADILERVLGMQVMFPNEIALFYEEPRAALDMLELPAKTAATRLLKHFGKIPAPPDLKRFCNIQEVETVCCKWKSSTKGKYWVGKDIREVRHALKGWGATADKLYRCMPKEVERGLFS